MPKPGGRPTKPSSRWETRNLPTKPSRPSPNDPKLKNTARAKKAADTGHVDFHQPMTSPSHTLRTNLLACAVATLPLVMAPRGGTRSASSSRTAAPSRSPPSPCKADKLVIKESADGFTAGQDPPLGFGGPHFRRQAGEHQSGHRPVADRQAGRRVEAAGANHRRATDHRQNPRQLLA